MAMTARIPSNPASAGRQSMPTEGSNGPRDPAAERALAEAQARRAEFHPRSQKRPAELHGRNGPDPARYGDWEVNGIASDF